MAVIVEGRVLDSSFYDRIFAKNQDAVRMQYFIYKAEDIGQPNGTAGGGKPAVLALHDYYRRKRLLVQRTNSGDSVILCMVDKDYDHLGRKLRRSDHIVYTQHADVESEIFHYCSLDSALSTALSLQYSESKLIANNLGDFINNLANLWKEWITLCAVALAVEARSSVRPSKRSGVNSPEFGPVDPGLVAAARSKITATGRVPDILKVSRSMEAKIARVYSKGEEHHLVKGKWIPYYLEHEIKKITAGQTIDITDFLSGISKYCLDSIEFDGAWSDYYHDKISKTLNSR